MEPFGVGGWRAIYHGPPASGTASVPHRTVRTEQSLRARAGAGGGGTWAFVLQTPPARRERAHGCTGCIQPWLARRCAVRYPRNLEPSRSEISTLTRPSLLWTRRGQLCRVAELGLWGRSARVLVLGEAGVSRLGRCRSPQAAVPGHLRMTGGARPRTDGRGRCRAARRSWYPAGSAQSIICSPVLSRPQGCRERVQETCLCIRPQSNTLG